MLFDQIQTDLKNAQLARDEVKTSTLRLLISEIRNAEIQKRAELSDQDIISAVKREAKKRKEAALGFRSGGREQSALKEEAELKILEDYLPPEMDSGQLTKIVEETIKETGASTLADMGQVMGAVMGKVQGQADGGTVSALVKEKLSK